MLPHNFIAVEGVATQKKLAPQQKVRVIACMDVNHYLIYENSIDKKAGFVNEGDHAFFLILKTALQQPLQKILPAYACGSPCNTHPNKVASTANQSQGVS